MADGDILYSGSTFDVVEDWSQVRSQGRAARRLKRGYRQNIWCFEAAKDGTRKWPLHPKHPHIFIDVQKFEQARAE